MTSSDKLFEPAKVTIELAEYEAMEAEIAELRETKDQILLDCYRAMLTGMIQRFESAPNFNVNNLLADVVLNLKKEHVNRIEDVEIIEDTEDRFLRLKMKYIDDGKKAKRGIGKVRWFQEDQEEGDLASSGEED